MTAGDTNCMRVFVDSTVEFEHFGNLSKLQNECRMWPALAPGGFYGFIFMPKMNGSKVHRLTEIPLGSSLAHITFMSGKSQTSLSQEWQTQTRFMQLRELEWFFEANSPFKIELEVRLVLSRIQEVEKKSEINLFANKLIEIKRNVRTCIDLAIIKSLNELIFSDIINAYK